MSDSSDSAGAPAGPSAIPDTAADARPTSGKSGPDATALLAAAGAVLARDGLDGLTVRAIAKQAGTTTMAIYSRLGGKDGVLDAINREGHTVLGRAIEQGLAAAPDNPINRISTICRILRRFAHGYPAHYQVMYGNPPQGYARGADAERRGVATWVLLRREVEAVVGADMASTRAYGLFALCHGLIELERGPIAALPPNADQAFNASVAAALRSLQPVGDGPAAAPGDWIPSSATVPFPDAPLEFADSSVRSETPRNAPCPCGSGKRYKHCHGAAA